MDVFPHASIRKGQLELIEDIEQAISQNSILLAHAPTGLGKTASALCAAIKLKGKQKIFFLTNRHTQHQIAIETLKLIHAKFPISSTDIIGKRWMCNQEIAGVFGGEFNEYCKAIVSKGECEFYNNIKQKKGITVEGKNALATLQRIGPQHNQQIIDFGRTARMCSYELALEMAKKADVIIADYNYIFNPHIQDNLLGKLGLELADVILIVDEGHNLPSRITDMLSSSLSSISIKNALLEAKKYGYSGFVPKLQHINNILQELSQNLGAEREKLVDRETFINKVKIFADYEVLRLELQTAADDIRGRQNKSYLGGIATFLEAWQEQSQGFMRYIAIMGSKFGSVVTLSYACLDPSILSRDIFSQIKAGVIMSGTLRPSSMYKQLLGIDRCMEKEYRSPFPPENKVSMIIPHTTTKFTARSNAMYEEIALKCSELAGLIPGNIAFFFPSYDLRDQVCQYLKTSKKLFWEKPDLSSEEKELLLLQFKGEKLRGGALLGIAGANFAEGIDLPGDLLQGVVVVGLPLAKPDLKTKETINYYQQKFNKGWEYGYIYPAMTKCIQSAGRCIRSEHDKGAIVYLDQRFVWPNYFHCLPQEGLIVAKDYKSILTTFFAKAPPAAADASAHL